MMRKVNYNQARSKISMDRHQRDVSVSAYMSEWGATLIGRHMKYPKI